MKKEIIEFYIEYIFAFFRKTNSKKGQGLFFRTIINSAEKSLARTQINNLYFVLSTLIQNEYIGVKEGDFIYLTEKGADCIWGDDKVIPLIYLEKNIYPKIRNYHPIHD